MEAHRSGRAELQAGSRSVEAPTPGTSIHIEDVSDAEQLRALDNIQVLVWGTGPRDIVPVHVLHVVASTGGIVIVAYDRATPIGFAFGFLARHNGHLYHASHMLGIHPEYQGQGIGAALKWAQRDRALSQGLDLMTWTFDPLEARNAYFNLHKLGAVSRSYKHNVYGELDDNLNRGLPSDRLIVEWWLREVSPNRVAPAPNGDQSEATILADVEGQPSLTLDHGSEARTLRIDAPRDIQRLKRESPEIALEWRLSQRTALDWALERGYVVRDFSGGAYVLIRDTEDGHAH